MRQKIITATGEADVAHIYEYLLERSPRSAELYYQTALSTFADFPDDFWQPVHAGPNLPDHVRVLYLSSPFRAYTLRVSITDEAVYLLAAFAPGLPDRFKDQATRRGLKSRDT
ncbi:MAG: hypothetical protein AAFQ15_05285 [Pseudomonadota bacterium]